MMMKHGLRFALIAAPLSLGACVEMGDTGSVNRAEDLAIACQTSEALAVAETTAEGTGLAAGLAQLQQVVILRDVGRQAEADRRLAQWNSSTGADAGARAETEDAVTETLERLRDERERRSGVRLCG